MWTVPIPVASGHINWKFTLYTRQHLCLFVQTREGKEKTNTHMVMTGEIVSIPGSTVVQGH